MRRSAPFIEEKHITRAASDTEQSRRSGQVINEMLGVAAEVNSWDDSPTPPKKTTSGASILTPEKNPPPAAKKIATTKPLGPVSHSVHRGQNAKRRNSAHIDWVSINNGLGLRITVDGNMDLQLREEWQRLLRETRNNGVGQYEFNLHGAPALSLAGLAMLMLFKEQKHSRKQDIKLYSCNRQACELLRWTGMDQHFVIQGEDSLAEPETTRH